MGWQPETQPKGKPPVEKTKGAETMQRLIDADALKEYIDCGHLRNPCEVCFSELDVVNLIDAQPTIAEPVRHGKWIIRDNPGTGWYRVTCSECGENVTATAPCIGFYPNVRVTWNYCPECGARMDEERKEE